MRAPFFCPVSTKSVDSRYTVYLAEIQKRFVYVGTSFLLAWICAYTQRVSLMYSMTSSLQQDFPGGLNTVKKGNESFLSFLEKIKDYISFTFQKVESIFLSDTHTINSLHAKDKAMGTPSMQVEIMQGEVLQRPLSSFSTLSGDASISGDGAVRLIFTDVEEAFYTLLSVSVFWCLFACLPVLLYHVLCFLQPGFYAWQSWRVCASVFRRVIFAYGVLQVVHLSVIPRLLSFFYSFQIERSSLYLHAETKVVSYVSLYVFVYCVTVVFLVVTGVWSSYKQRQVLRSLHATHVFPEKRLSSNVLSAPSDKSDNLRKTGCLTKQKGFNRDKYKEHRGKMWWGCLLVAAFVSPPEISSQTTCTFLLIFLSEISIWVAYILSCRFLNKTYLSNLYF